MALCVTTPGTIRMPLWSADNWDSPPMVIIPLSCLTMRLAQPPRHISLHTHAHAQIADTPAHIAHIHGQHTNTCKYTHTSHTHNTHHYACKYQRTNTRTHSLIPRCSVTITTERLGTRLTHAQINTCTHITM